MGQASSSSSSSPPNDARPSPHPPAPAPDLTLSLPDECLAHVLSFLSSQDRNSCSLVCRRWCSVDASTRRRLLLLARFEISPSLPSLLSRFSSVSSLSLKCSRKLFSIDDAALSLIAASLSPSLRRLKLKGCLHISDEGLRSFSLHCPPLLYRVSFASCSFGIPGLASLLLNCPSVRDLSLKRLRSLDSHSSPSSFDEVAAAEDARCFGIERMCIKEMHNARLFAPLIRDSKRLRSLVVCRSSGNWDQVLEIALQGTESSKISEIQLENVRVGDAGLIAIAGFCPDLEVLHLSKVTDCSDKGIAAISNSCRRLRKVHIDAWARFGGRSIGDEGISILGAKCSLLQELVVMGVPVTVLSLNVLASSCACLERMALCNTEWVGDAEMAVIAEKFSGLKKLCIKNCPITVAGVEAVVNGCRELEKLKVKRCRGVSQESLNHLRSMRCGLVVSVDSGDGMFDGDGAVGSESEVANAGEAGREEEAVGQGRWPRAERRASSSSAHVICSSRGAMLLKSKFRRRRRSIEEIEEERAARCRH